MNETKKEYIRILVDTLYKGEDGIELEENQKDLFYRFLCDEITLDQLQSQMLDEEN